MCNLPGEHDNAKPGGVNKMRQAADDKKSGVTGRPGDSQKLKQRVGDILMAQAEASYCCVIKKPNIQDAGKRIQCTGTT